MILNPFESCSLQFLDKIADTGRNLWKLYSGLKPKILHLNDFNKDFLTALAALCLTSVMQWLPLSNSKWSRTILDNADPTTGPMTRILTDPSPSSEHWQHRNQPQDWPCYRPSDLTMTWKLWCQGSFAPLRCFYICYIFHFLNPGNILLMKAKTPSQETRSVLFLHPIVNTIAIAIIVLQQ